MEVPHDSGVERHTASERGGESKVGAGLEALIAEARGGSTSALGQLLERCRKYLLLVANESLDSDLRPKVGPSDLVQDTFLEAHQDFSRFEGTTEQELLAWLTKILHHRLANNIRHYRGTLKRDMQREVTLEDENEIDRPRAAGQVAPLQTMVERDDIERLRAALGRLPQPMRDVLVLRSWERKSYAEIAAQLGGTPESVRKLWGRGVRRLQAEFQEES
jgi:RNA polymerase sigma-70 factor (ECF subfamily)